MVIYNKKKNNQKKLEKIWSKTKKRAGASAFDRIRPPHMVQDVHAVLGDVVVHHRLLLCLRPTKGAQTCVHSAQNANILPQLSLVHRVASPHLSSSACCFTEGGTPIFVCPWCQPGYTSKFAQVEVANKVRDKRDNESSKPHEKCNNESLWNDVWSIWPLMAEIGKTYHILCNLYVNYSKLK